MVENFLISNVFFSNFYIDLFLSFICFYVNQLKGKDQLWSCNCIVKETLWNRSEKFDHLAYKYWCVLQGSGIIKMIRNLAQVTSTVHRKMYMGLHDTCAISIRSKYI